MTKNNQQQESMQETRAAIHIGFRAASNALRDNPEIENDDLIEIAMRAALRQASLPTPSASLDGEAVDIICKLNDYVEVVNSKNAPLDAEHMLDYFLCMTRKAKSAIAAKPAPKGVDGDVRCKAQQIEGCKECLEYEVCGGHPDDVAVDKFATAMKAKLAKKRADGRGGWEDPKQCSVEFLSELLHGHIAKGDPVDVGNLAMMLFNRGSGIVRQAPPLSALPPEAEIIRCMCQGARLSPDKKSNRDNMLGALNALRSINAVPTSMTEDEAVRIVEPKLKEHSLLKSGDRDGVIRIVFRALSASAVPEKGE